MNNEPILCKKCAHRQYEGTHCDFCGTSLLEKPAPKERLSRFARLRILGFAAILILFFCVGLFFHHSSTTKIAPDPPPVTIFPSQQAGVVNKLMQSATQSNGEAPTGAEIFAKAAPGIVTLYQDDDTGKHQHVIGTGFLLDDTTIATNNHVVHGISTISAQHDDGAVSRVLRVLGANDEQDVALLQMEKVEPPEEKAAIDSLEAAGRQLGSAAASTAASSVSKNTAANGLHAGRTALLNVGDAVIAAGTPTGLGGSVSQGIVTAMSGGLVKTNLPVKSDWSGGPLLNMQGEVVGMLTSQPPGAASGNYALPIEWATSLLAGISVPPPNSPSGKHGTVSNTQPTSHDFGPYNFKLAAMQKHSLPFNTPADLENAQFSARLTAPAGAHLHFTISHQGRIMYDSGDTAGARFTLSLKRGEYVMLVENSSKSAASDVAIAGTFSSDQ